MTEVTTTGLARSRARVPWYAFAVFALIAAAAIVTLLGDTETSAIAATIGIFAGSVAAGFIFIRKARQVDPGERRAWTIMGVGFSVAAMGVVVLALQVTITGDAPTFGPIDLFFLASYVLIITGFALLPNNQRIQRHCASKRNSTCVCKGYGDYGRYWLGEHSFRSICCLVRVAVRPCRCGVWSKCGLGHSIAGSSHHRRPMAGRRNLHR